MERRYYGLWLKDIGEFYQDVVNHGKPNAINKKIWDNQDDFEIIS
jgi:hypothetical protein